MVITNNISIGNNETSSSIGIFCYDNDTSLNGITSLTFNHTTTREGIDIELAPDLVSFKLPYLETITGGGYFGAFVCPKLETVDLSKLRSSGTGCNVSIGACPNIKSVDLRNFVNCGGELYIVDFADITSSLFDIINLNTQFNGILTIRNTGLLIDISNYKNIRGLSLLGNSNLTNLTIQNDSNITTMTVSGNSNLTSMDIQRGCHVESLIFAGGNNLSKLDISNLSGSEVVYFLVKDENITDLNTNDVMFVSRIYGNPISITSLPYLTTWSSSNCNIGNLGQPGENQFFNWIPAVIRDNSLPALKYVDLSNNNMSSFVVNAYLTMVASSSMAGNIMSGSMNIAGNNSPATSSIDYEGYGLYIYDGIAAKNKLISKGWTVITN